MTRAYHQSTTILGNCPQLILNQQGEILSLPLTRDYHKLGRDRQLADLIVPEHWDIISGIHATLKRIGQDYYIYDGNGQDKPSTNGLFINHARITVNAGHRLQEGEQLQIGQNPQHLITLTYYHSTANIPSSQALTGSVALGNVITIGRDPAANLPLESPIVSRRHAVIEPDPRGGYILKDYSSNGTFINGQRVNDSAPLIDHAIVHIGPYILRRQGNYLVVGDPGNKIRLDAYHLKKTVKKNGESKTLLDDISLFIEPGQFVALVGGSGAGKSTLMRTLLGIEKTDQNQGRIYLNGEDLRINFNIYRSHIGYVPQDDIIHQDLTVEEVLRYAAQLRLPHDTKIEEAIARINTILKEIQMSDYSNKSIKELSGGQRKRVSIGVELLSDPKLFFLDEPTSGLDPGLDKKMMELLQGLAKNGRTIILVTHATSHIHLCDRLVFLGKGGRLCFFGKPAEAIEFFQKPDFADIYNHLALEEKVKEEQENFLNSSHYAGYISPYLNQQTPPKSNPPQPSKPSGFKQLLILSQRYFQLVIRDPINLALALLPAPLGIFLITLALGDKNPLVLGAEDDPTLAPLALRVLFVFTCGAIWVGLSSSLQEIVKEKNIYQRERLVNLNLFSYLGSKLAILGGLVLGQTLLMAIAILCSFQSPQPQIMPWTLGMGITTLLTLFTCTNLGLMISALVSNSAQANSALPLLLLPQIIFSGVLFKMEGISRGISWLMLSRWSVGAYGTLIDINHLIPPPIQLPDGSSVPQLFEATKVYDPTGENLALNWGILCLHSLLYFTVTWWAQKKKDLL